MKFRLKQTSKWHDQQEQIVNEHFGSYLDKQGKAFIKITSLKQLLQFVKTSKGGEIVIGFDKDQVFIEDYDDYRE